MLQNIKKNSFSGLELIIFNFTGHWKRAYESGKQSLSQAEWNRLFLEEGKGLEKAGRFRDAEHLYTAAQMYESAFEMYRSSKNYDQLIRLVAQYRPDQLAGCHFDIARQLQLDGNRKSAEKHLLAVLIDYSEIIFP